MTSRFWKSGGSALSLRGGFSAGASLSPPTATLTMTQLPDANRIFQRATLSGGGQGKGQGTVAVTISSATGGTIHARCSSGGGTRGDLQAEWAAGSIATSATTANVTGVDARLGWFYLDLLDSSGTWQNGTTLVGMGALHAWAGQSLMSRMIGRADTSGSYSSTGITPSANGRVLASYNDTNTYVPSPSSMPWQLPADGDGTNPSSVGVGQFLLDAIATLGVNCGVIGHAHGGIWIGQYVSGQADWTQFSGVIAKAGGAFEAFFWGQGHSDSSIGATDVTYKAELDVIYAQVAAINSFSGFKTYIWTIPAVQSNTLGTSWQYTQVRKGASDWCAANSATYIHAYDFDVPGGVHEANTVSSAAWFGRTMFRATRANYGLSSGLGPSLVSATRSGQTITLTLTDVGQTTISLTGSAAALFFAFRPGESNNKDAAINDNRYPFSSVSVTNKTTLSLVLANDPGVGQALDLWLNYGIVAVDPGANYIVDDRVDDGLSRGRNLQANFAPIIVAAPTPGGATNAPPTVAARVSPQTMTGTSMTYGTAASGFGTRRTGGTAANSGGFTAPGFTVECFIVAPTAGAQLVIFNGLAGGDWLGIDSTNHINSSSGASGATALTAGKLYHVAYVHGPTGMRVYIKNITDATASVRDYNSSTSFGTNWGGQPAAALQLGHLNGGFVFTGEIDEAALFYGERYTGTTHTPPTTPYVGNETNLMMLWHLDSNLTEAVQH